MSQNMQIENIKTAFNDEINIIKEISYLNTNLLNFYTTRDDNNGNNINNSSSDRINDEFNNYIFQYNQLLIDNPKENESSTEDNLNDEENVIKDLNTTNSNTTIPQISENEPENIRSPNLVGTLSERLDNDIRAASSFHQTSNSFQNTLRIPLPLAIAKYKPAKEIDASINTHPPIKYKLVEIFIPKRTFSKQQFTNSTTNNNSSKPSDGNLQDPRMQSNKYNENFFSPSSPCPDNNVKSDPRKQNNSPESLSQSDDEINSLILQNHPILNSLVQKSKWYQEQSSRNKIEINQLISQLSNELNRFHKNTSLHKIFDIWSLEKAEKISQVFSEIGICVTSKGIIETITKSDDDGNDSSNNEEIFNHSSFSIPTDSVKPFVPFPSSQVPATATVVANSTEILYKQQQSLTRNFPKNKCVHESNYNEYNKNISSNNISNSNSNNNNNSSQNNWYYHPPMNSNNSRPFRNYNHNNNNNNSNNNRIRMNNNNIRKPGLLGYAPANIAPTAAYLNYNSNLYSEFQFYNQFPNPGNFHEAFNSNSKHISMPFGSNNSNSNLKRKQQSSHWDYMLPSYMMNSNYSFQSAGAEMAYTTNTATNNSSSNNNVNFRKYNVRDCYFLPNQMQLFPSNIPFHKQQQGYFKSNGRKRNSSIMNGGNGSMDIKRRKNFI